MTAPEMIKYVGERGKLWLLEIMREAWRTEKIPKDWEENLLIPIHKKGDEAECNNYRAICLSSVAYKFYTGIIEKKFRKELEGKLEEEKAAFRKKIGTADNILLCINLSIKDRIKFLFFF